MAVCDRGRTRAYPQLRIMVMFVRADGSCMNVKGGDTMGRLWHVGTSHGLGGVCDGVAIGADMHAENLAYAAILPEHLQDTCLLLYCCSSQMLDWPG